MQGWKKYRDNEIMMSDPIKITIKAYEKCIAELKHAKEQIESYRFSQADPSLIKVEQIYHELFMQLNHEHLPELAGKIADLLEWLILEVRDVKINRNAAQIDPMIRVTQNLLAGYKGA